MYLPEVVRRRVFSLVAPAMPWPAFGEQGGLALGWALQELFGGLLTAWVAERVSQLPLPWAQPAAALPSASASWAQVVEGCCLAARRPAWTLRQA